MLGSQHMTFPSEEAKTQAHSTHRGMAYFACTGPMEKTCGDCVFRGYSRTSSKEKWSEALQRMVPKTYRTQGCKKFKDLTGKNGPVVPKAARSCKYFEDKK